MGHIPSVMREYVNAPCPYLDGEVETLSFVRCPWMPSDIYGSLTERGYRHSGDIFYIPACRASLPLRVSMAMFNVSKKQHHV